jgi:hypothetical protein
MALQRMDARLRTGWWAGAEPSDPLAALRGSLLRAEMTARLPGLRPVLVHGLPAAWTDPGFTGEPAVLTYPPLVDVFVACLAAEPGGPKLSHSLLEAGVATVAVAVEEDWGLDAHQSVGAPFGVPEPAVLARRHLPKALLQARAAYLRVVEGLPRRYVLVDERLIAEADGREDLRLAFAHLARDGAEVVALAPGPLSAEDPEIEEVLRLRRAEAEEGRHQAEDWAGWPGRPWQPLRVTSPLDLAAAVKAAEVVVAQSGPLMALAWALGVPHVALGEEGGSASNFAAWTGDASALVAEPAGIVATTGNIFARRGEPPGLKRLEATLDEALDEAAATLAKAAAEARPSTEGGLTIAERAAELEAVNEALRSRLAAERYRFGERAALLEKTAETTVESAIKAVHGQDVIIRRKLEETEKEMRRLQEETAKQQAELRAIYSTKTMRALAPARQFYERLRRVAAGSG